MVFGFHIRNLCSSACSPGFLANLCPFSTRLQAKSHESVRDSALKICNAIDIRDSKTEKPAAPSKKTKPNGCDDHANARLDKTHLPRAHRGYWIALAVAANNARADSLCISDGSDNTVKLFDAQTGQGFNGFHRAEASSGPHDPGTEGFAANRTDSAGGRVLHWVIQGKRDKEVADILSTSPRTIHNHLRSILRKLNTDRSRFRSI